MADQVGIALEAESAGLEIRVAPAIAYGASGEHEGFAGTISIGTEALQRTLLEFGRSALRWAHRAVFVNGHGGNVEALAGAVTGLRDEGRDAAWCPCAPHSGDLHAGHTETSVLLHLWPTSVRVDEMVAGNTGALAELLPSMRSGGVAAVSGVGVLGDPTAASPMEGDRLFGEMVSGALTRIRRWAPDQSGLLR